eukprot:COSAG06_NODE_22294_length_728_cov_0.930048_1_plen_37_part_10
MLARLALSVTGLAAAFLDIAMHRLVPLFTLAPPHHKP